MEIFLFFSGRQKLRGRHKKTWSVGLVETQVFFFLGLMKELINPNFLWLKSH